MVKLKSLLAFRKWIKSVLVCLRLLGRAAASFHSDDGFFLSAGIAFNILVNLIPFIMLLLSLLGSYLYKAEDVLNHIRQYLWNVAPGLDPETVKTLFQVVRVPKLVGILGFVGLLWASTWVFGSLRIALNAVFRVKKGRGAIRGVGIDLLMIFLVGFLLLLSMALTSFATFIQGYQQSVPPSVGPVLHWILKYILPLLFTCCVFFLIYIIVPNRKIRFGSAFRASLFSGLLWELAKQFFGWYVAHLTRLPVIYGSLTTVAIFVFWVYYSAAILLMGGELAFLLEVKEASEPKTPSEAISDPKESPNK
jgi:membrane protein